MQTKKITAVLVFFLIVIVLTQFTLIQSAQAACTGIVYVAKGSTAVNPGGCSWADAYPELQDALKSATLASGDEIWVTAGTYYPDEGVGQVNNDRNSTFRLINGVSIYGGFAGVETQRIQRNPIANATILSGEFGNIGNSLDNAYHVVTATSINLNTTLDGVTIRDGYANAGSDFGGGIYISASNSNLRLTGITFVNNYAGKGGGLASFVSSQTLTRVIFSGNIARNYGGGIFNQDGSPSLLDVVFDNNQTQQQGGPGGGMYNTNSNPAVYTVAPVLTNVTFSNNSSLRGGGGGFYSFRSQAILTNVTFSGNNAYVRGGAILNEGSSPVLNNVTFSGNTAPSGSGGAIRNISASGGIPSNPVIMNSVLWDNGSEEIITNAGSSITLIDSVVEGGCPALGSCTNVINADPLLSGLMDAGGFTQVRMLGAGSSAIDAGGVNSSCAVTDQRGVARPQGTACDIGAYEADATVVPTPTSQPTATATGTAVPSATATPIPSTNTPVPPTATYTPSPTLAPTLTNTPLPTATNTPAPTFVPTSTNTPLPTVTNTPTPTFVPTSTSTPLPTATNTPTPTFVPTSTNTPVPTVTFTPVPTNTSSPTETPVSTATPAACGAIVYVAKGSTAVNPEGCSWADAYPEVQDALASGTLASGDEIWVTAGTYYPDEGAGQVDDDRNSTFQMINGVSIYGGFAGVETQRSQRDPLTNVTILSGDIGASGTRADNAYHVVTATSINSITELDGVTIQDGYVDIGNDFGGGIYISASNSNLRLTDITITNNYAGNGGGLASFVSSPTLTRVIFSGNTARQYGGGIYNQDGSPSLHGCGL